MSLYPPESPEDEQVNRQTKLPSVPPITKYGEVKRGFDFLITTPGKLRRGIARHGDNLLGFVDYNIKLFRSEERKWSLYLEWVDLEGGGHRIVLPHEVVQGVLQRANSIIAECRRDRAQKGANTRKLKQQTKD